MNDIIICCKCHKKIKDSEISFYVTIVKFLNINDNEPKELHENHLHEFCYLDMIIK